MRNFIRWLICLIFNLIARVEVRGYENLPKEGSFVIATNHLGFVDVPIAFYALDRWDMFVMIGEKWENIGLFRWVGKYFNFVFIDRFNPDIKTLRKVISLMQENNILVIAPEGTRSRHRCIDRGETWRQLSRHEIKSPDCSGGHHRHRR